MSVSGQFIRSSWKVFCWFIWSMCHMVLYWFILSICHMAFCWFIWSLWQVLFGWSVSFWVLLWVVWKLENKIKNILFLIFIYFIFLRILSYIPLKIISVCHETGQSVCVIKMRLPEEKAHGISASRTWLVLHVPHRVLHEVHEILSLHQDISGTSFTLGKLAHATCRFN